MFRRLGFSQAASNLMAVLVVAINSDGAVAQSADLDFNKLSMTFSEDFDDTLSVSPWGPNTRWIAHTPWNGDFGDAHFVDPKPGVFPFTIDKGFLKIEARKNLDGKWESGLLASTDGNGRGFSQQYGYFEMRAKLPKGPGVWPAFWLVSVLDKTSPISIEIDALEYYGHVTNNYQTNLHVYNTGPSSNLVSQDVDLPVSPHNVGVAPDSLTDDFNTYGVMVDRTWIIFYLNRHEVFRVKTPKEHQRPLMVLLNLALGPGWPINHTPDPSFMYVDYVHVYKMINE
jgi:beta-glucanase (GH16 family)